MLPSKNFASQQRPMLDRGRRRSPDEYPNAEYSKAFIVAKRSALRSFVYIKVSEFCQFKIVREAFDGEENELAQDDNCHGLEIALGGLGF